MASGLTCQSSLMRLRFTRVAGVLAAVASVVCAACSEESGVAPIAQSPEAGTPEGGIGDVTAEATYQDTSQEQRSDAGDALAETQDTGVEGPLLDAEASAPALVQVWVSEGDLKLHVAGVGHSITLQTALQSKYVGADQGGGGALRATSDQAAGWETFVLVDLNGDSLQSGDLVALRTTTGSFWSADKAGGGSLAANGASLREWEIFRIEKISAAGEIATGDQIALRTWDCKHYVAAVNGGGGDLVATSEAVSGWEAFRIDLGPATTRWLARDPDQVWTDALPSGAIVVDDAQTYQSVVGFGSSFTESASWLLQAGLSEASRAEALASLFDATSGIGLTAMRLPLGATDMMIDGSSYYTYDDLPLGQTDYSLEHFSLERDLQWVVPVVQAARSLSPQLALVASPWSPPAWMKTTQLLVSGKLKADDATRKAYADYFVKSVQGYAAQGIPVQAVTPQNEPLFEPWEYPGTRWEAADEAAFVGGYLGKAFQAAGLSTKILTYDHNWDHPEYPLSVLADPAAAQYVAGVAFHCYAGSIDAHDAIHQAYADKELWVTECSAGNWESDPFGGKLWLLIETMRRWGAGVLLWNVAMKIAGGPGKCEDCRGVLSVEPGLGLWLRNVQYDALGHFSKFVRPGAVRIRDDGGPQDVMHVAFRNTDGSHALVVWNRQAQEVAVSVSWNQRSFEQKVAAGAAVTFFW